MPRLPGSIWPARPRVEETYTLGESLARFATDPAVSGLLLTLGMLGLLIEMQTLHGIAGIVGVGSLALFFGSHVYAGFSNGLVAVLALVGLFGILWELHVVPGHGIPGVLGRPRAPARACSLPSDCRSSSSGSRRSQPRSSSP